MDNPNLHEDLLKDILERQTISEKQSDAERQRVHQKWREDNPQKVRDQVKRHEMKSRTDKSDPSTGHNAARDKERHADRSKCSKCGSTENVQRDHQNGLSGSTVALCHKCHTNRPQQNKPGDKSVKGGTLKVHKGGKKKKLAASYNRSGDPLLETWYGPTEKGPEGLPKALRRRSKATKWNIRPTKNQRDGGPTLLSFYPHVSDPRILVKYADAEVSDDFALANAGGATSQEIVTIKFLDNTKEWEDALEAEYADIQDELEKMEATGNPNVATDERRRKWVEINLKRAEEKSGSLRYLAGREIQGRILNAGQLDLDVAPKGHSRATQDRLAQAPQELERETREKLEALWAQLDAETKKNRNLPKPDEWEKTNITDKNRGADFGRGATGNEKTLQKEIEKTQALLKRITEKSEEPVLQFEVLSDVPELEHEQEPHATKHRPQINVPVSWLVGGVDGIQKTEQSDDRLLEKAYSRLKVGGESAYAAGLMPQRDKEGNWAESADDYLERVGRKTISLDQIYDDMTNTGAWRALSKDKKGVWRWLSNARDRPNEIKMLIPRKLDQPNDRLVYRGDGHVVDPSQSVEGIKDPETDALINADLDKPGIKPGIPSEPAEVDASGMKHDLVTLWNKTAEDEADPDSWRGKKEKGLKGLDLEHGLPQPSVWKKLFDLQFVEYDGDDSNERLEEHFNIGMKSEEQKEIMKKAKAKVIEDLAIRAYGGVEEWKKLNQHIMVGMWPEKQLKDVKAGLKKLELELPGYEDDKRYIKLLAHKKALLECPNCRGGKFDEDGEPCSSCLGTGGKLTGDRKRNDLAKSNKQKKLDLLEDAREMYASNPESFEKDLQRAKLSLVQQLVALPAAIEAMHCSVCRGSGKIRIDRDQELSEVSTEIEKHKKQYTVDNVAVKLAKYEKQLDLLKTGTGNERLKIILAYTDKAKRKSLKDQLISLNQKGQLDLLLRLISTPTNEWGWSGSLEDRVRKNVNRLKQRKEKTKEKVKDLTRRKGRLKGRREHDDCWACSGTGNAKHKSKTRIRGAPDLHLQLETKKLCDIIADRYSEECSECGGDGFHDEQSVFLRIREQGQLEPTFNVINDMLDKGEIRNQNWKKNRAALRKDLIDTFMKKRELAVDWGIPKATKSDLEEPAGKFYQRGKIGGDTAEDIAQKLKGAGIQAWAEGRPCDACRGKGKTRTFLSNALKGMWAQTFSRLVENSLPWTNLSGDTNRESFLSKIMEATIKHEMEELETIPIKDKNGEQVSAYVVAWVDPSDGTQWGYRKDDPRRFLKISDLVDRVGGQERKQCDECNSSGIVSTQREDVDEEAQESEQFLHPPGRSGQGRRIKLTSREREKLTKGEVESIETDLEVYKKCDNCDGVGRLGRREALKLDRNPIYVERRGAGSISGAYNHVIKEFNRAVHLATSGKSLEKLPPRPLTTKGIAKITQVNPRYAQEYGGDLLKKAKELALQDQDRGFENWDNIPVSQSELIRELDKFNVGRSIGESRTFSELQDPSKDAELTYWQDRVRNEKKKYFLNKARAFEIAANRERWVDPKGRINWKVAEIEWEKMDTSRQEAYIDMAEGGTLTVGDPETKENRGEVEIEFEDVESGVSSQESFQILTTPDRHSQSASAELDPTLLVVRPISELRKSDERKFQKEHFPGFQGERTRKQGRGARGKRGGGRGKGLPPKSRGKKGRSHLSRKEREAEKRLKKEDIDFYSIQTILENL
jgi:hypothetical protein